MTGYEQIFLYFKQTHSEMANKYLVTVLYKKNQPHFLY